MFLRRGRRFWAAAVGLAVVVVAIGLGSSQRWQSERLRIVAENTAKATDLKTAIDSRFPAGTAESLVVTFLQKEHAGYVRWPAGNRTEYGLPVGDEPSEVSNCGSWTRGVRLRFESGRLVRSAVERWSDDCL